MSDTDRTDPINEAGRGNSAEGMKLSRRKLLQAGAASAPLIITLQSGSAWAQSAYSCAERVVFPIADDSNRADLIDILKHEGGLSKPEAEAQVDSLFTSHVFEPSNVGHQAFLKAEATSCWSSIEYSGLV